MYICDSIRLTKHHKTGCECVCGLASVLFPISTPLIPAVQWRWWRRPVSGDEQWETRAYRRANTTSGQWSRTRAMPPVAGSRSSHQVTQVTRHTSHIVTTTSTLRLRWFSPFPSWPTSRHPGIAASWHPGTLLRPNVSNVIICVCCPGSVCPLHPGPCAGVTHTGDRKICLSNRRVLFH